MRYFLGLDGGGTKTAALLLDEAGNRAASTVGAGASYRHYGKENVVKTLQQLWLHCLDEARIPASAVAGVCIGLPSYGESSSGDADMLARLTKTFPKLLLVNDVEVGWAGSLACEPGINVVAGTGSIAFGRDAAGNTARSGGWCEHFGDEGSSYWLGMRGMQLFSKQADGRVPKGQLYQMVRERYNIGSDDFEFVRIVEEKLLPYRKEVAAFQKLLADAGDAGDTTVPPLYSEAAGELFLLAQSVKNQLCIEGTVNVSYSGGTFRAGAMILEPFEARLREAGMTLCAPELSPVAGAALLAVQTFAPEKLGAVRKALLSAENEV